ncbi:hypothetical protein ABIB40_001753 [Pedobacter sp. UYP30]|uniref:hypothetical protein n=1 Tax=Pedobacter sp. UYP30 TaxID=1756400 RepID=UPI003393DF96
MTINLKSSKLTKFTSFDDLDHIFTSPTGDIEYYQVAGQMTSESTVETEFGALEKTKDNYPKYLLTTDSFTRNRSGVKHLNVFNWLLDANEK